MAKFKTMLKTWWRGKYRRATLEEALENKGGKWVRPKSRILFESVLNYVKTEYKWLIGLALAVLALVFQLL